MSGDKTQFTSGQLKAISNLSNQIRTDVAESATVIGGKIDSFDMNITSQILMAELYRPSGGWGTYEVMKIESPNPFEIAGMSFYASGGNNGATLYVYVDDLLIYQKYIHETTGFDGYIPFNFKCNNKLKVDYKFMEHDKSRYLWATYGLRSGN